MIDQIDVYCDGSYAHKKWHCASYAYALYLGNELLKSDSGQWTGHKYNNTLTAEIAGCLFGLREAVKYDPSLIVVYTDHETIFKVLPKELDKKTIQKAEHIIHCGE
jgi:ribonuclease HI